MSFNIDKHSELISRLPSELKLNISSLIKMMTEGSFFADDSPITKGSTYQIKVSKENFDKIQTTIKTKFKGIIKLGAKRQADFLVNNYRIRFIETGKKSVGQLDAVATSKQERASLWIIKRVLKDKRKYTTANDIRKDPKYKELVSIYPEVDDDPEWLNNFFAQQKKMLEIFRSVNFTEYNRDGGFMDYISKIIKDKFKIAKKDSWNPADIWLIQNEQQVRNSINEALESKTSSISKLNDIMKNLFEKRKVVGVSLKKVSGKEARWEELNTKDALMKQDKFTMSLSKSVINFTNKKDGTLTSADCRIIIKDKDDEVEFQIRQNGKGFMQNLKFDGKRKKAGAARIGKVPVDLMTTLFRENGIGSGNLSYVNNHTLYPKSLEAFKKVAKKYEAKFNFIRSKVQTDTSTVNFIKNMISSYNSDDLKNGVSHTKLMELDFLFCIYSLPEKKRNKMLTDMVYLAEKRGSQFGPFGKLY